MTQKSEEQIDGIALLKAIGDKNNKEKAEESLVLFTTYFENKIRLYAEIQALKLKLTEVDVLQAMQCTFVKVWKYPNSFDMNKSRCKDEETAIIIWLKRIVASQLFDYAKNGYCVDQKEEEDLSVIENAQDFVEYYTPDMDSDKKMELVLAFNKKLSLLDDKHRIIYLTYKAYELSGKKLPRRLLSKLRKRLGISQTTIRVYKREAYMMLNDKPKN